MPDTELTETDASSQAKSQWGAVGKVAKKVAKKVVTFVKKTAVGKFLKEKGLAFKPKMPKQPDDKVHHIPAGAWMTMCEKSRKSQTWILESEEGYAQCPEGYTMASGGCDMRRYLYHVNMSAGVYMIVQGYRIDHSKCPENVSYALLMHSPCSN